jgi:NADPH:quinone reductase-like Zn-dependent oxidoreductase
MPGLGLPNVPGMDVAGDVLACGGRVDGVELGTRVIARSHWHCGRCARCAVGDHGACTAGGFLGATAPGGYAERVALPASHVFALADHLTYSEGAALPTSLSTAWRGLVITADLRAGEWVMIHGAGAGVSTTAIQLAKHIGARVVATSRSERTLERAHDLGADVLVHSATDDVAAAARAATAGRGVDVVFDHVGTALFEPSVAALATDGRLVVCGTTSGDRVSLSLPAIYYRGISVMGIKSQSYRQFERMLDVFWAARIHPVIAAELPLAAAAEAHRRLEQGDVFGKLILIP